jgi:hypothetical protein
VETKMVRLTQEEFGSALHKGLGRAFLHVQKYGDEELEALIKNALLHNLVYDVQCEGKRADWLFSILKNTNKLSSYEEFLIENLPTIVEDWDFDQALDLLLQFAKNGSQKAREALYAEFNKQSFNESWIGGEQIVELDGINGFIYVAERIGKRLREDDQFWEDDFQLNDIKNRFGEDKVQNAINERLKTSDDLRVYLEKLTKWELPKRRSKEQIYEEMRIRFPLQQIQQDIENAHGVIPSSYMQFGKHALDKDIREIFEHLKTEDRPPQIIRLLWVFRRRTLPEINPQIISYALAEDNELASAAISALSNSSNPELHELALDIMKHSEWNRATAGFELLIKNFKTADGPVIENVLKRAPMDLDRETIHNVVFDLVLVCEANNSIDLTNALNWIYDNSPCMNCRGRAVKLLIENSALSESMLDECLVDGDEEIRGIAAKAKSPQAPKAP